MDTIRRAQAGDQEAFEAIVERYTSAIFRLAAAIVGEDGAADLTQETFVAAWRHLPRLRRPEALESWLRRICVNQSRTWLRREHRRPVTAAFDATNVKIPSAQDFSAGVEARAILEPAFERLAPDQRALLALHYSLGLSIAEVAEALDLRVGTAKSRLNRALVALRSSIGTSDARFEPEVVS